MDQLNVTHVGRDIARKCGEDVTSAVHRNFALCDEIDDRAWIAIYSASMAVATAAGAIRAAMPAVSPQEVAVSLFAMLEPLAFQSIAKMHNGDRHG